MFRVRGEGFGVRGEEFGERGYEIEGERGGYRERGSDNRLAFGKKIG